MDEIIHLKGKHYILASSSMADDRTQVIKHGNTFAIFDRFGDIQPVRFGEQGIFHSGTRYLSHSELKINGTRPFLLSSNTVDDNTLLTVDLTNPDIMLNEALSIPRGNIHLFRSKFLWNTVSYENIKVSNFGVIPIEIEMSLSFENDFHDIFEVRGQNRKKRGTRGRITAKNKVIEIPYKGLDGGIRTTVIKSSEIPAKTSKNSFSYQLRLNPKESKTMTITVRCGIDKRKYPHIGFKRAYSLLVTERKSIKKNDMFIHTSNEQFNDWLNRSYADIHMLTSLLPGGMYPYAGIPWFSTVFGRDGIFTALEYLWINPEIAKGVLSTLARTQARKNNPEQDANPGKIIHETRKGEMAALNEIPFGRYYGSIDVTPLFIVLAGRYFERTHDRPFIKRLWPHIERALDWIEKYGDRDKDGFVEYSKKSSNGLINQGWKDSNDSIFHKKGALALGPIALCEVQGYVYDAFIQASILAGHLGLKEKEKKFNQKAKALKKKFQKHFWIEKLSTYALALDGKKRKCEVRSSNPGHCLYSGIASNEHAEKISESFLKPDLFSNWGIRTLSSKESLYNPMSYHNGSVWPHDNAIIAAGMARYGRKDLAAKILAGMFDASLFVELQRLPELFCGFHRRPGEGPTLYSGACSPQAWAAGSVFLLLQSILGLTLDAVNKKIIFDHPHLPPFLETIDIKNLSVGNAKVDIQLVRHNNDVGINILRRTGRVEVVGLK